MRRRGVCCGMVAWFLVSSAAMANSGLRHSQILVHMRGQPSGSWLAGLLESALSILSAADVPGGQACCLPGGSCIETDPGMCTAQGGTPQGPGTTCAMVPCGGPVEACCLSTGGCIDTTATNCFNQTGTPQGPGTTCATAVCGPQACCLLAGGCIDVSTNECFNQNGSPQGPGTTCATVICGGPVEACCLSTGGCVDTTTTNCFNQTGTPQGPGTTCATVFCSEPPQACCFPDGSCSYIDPTSCSFSGGMPQGPGTDCGTVFCPQPSQACCFPDGSCSYIDPSSCFSFGGTPQGPGTDCGTVFCPQPSQACCFPDGSCSYIDPSSCFSFGGTPQGPGTDCGTVFCPQPSQACCLPGGSCIDTDSSNCFFQGGTPQGPGTTCGTVICGGTIPNDDCFNATPIGDGMYPFSNVGATTDGPDELVACNFFGYTQVGADIWYCYTASCSGTVTVTLCGSSYDSKLAVYNGCTCPAASPPVACNDDFCGLQSQVSFSAFAGNGYLIRIGGYNNAMGSGTLSVSCSGAFEACCYFDGSCSDLAPGDCVSFGGTPQGPGTTCGTVICPAPFEACCYPDGTCSDTTSSNCVSTGGSPQGPGTTCGTTFCPQPTQACCYADGTCADLAPFDCSFQGGISQGPGTSCGTTFCPQPNEACCYPNGSCIDQTSNDCFINGGNPQGPGTTCGTTFCPQPTQACCYPDGTCSDLYPPDCMFGGGTPQGLGTSCGTTFCPQPLEACCYMDGTCVDLTASDCSFQGGISQGPGTSCATIFCPQPFEACCYPDGTCTDQTANDCFINGGNPQGPGTNCGTTFCPQPTQACCYSDGTCSDLYPPDCTSGGGTPQGPGTTCGTTICPQPTEACCYMDGTCVDLTPSDCSLQGGISQGPGTSCATTICPQPLEACCYPDGSCVDQTANDCFINGGNPQGPGTTCGTVFCPQPTEACCYMDGTCVDLTASDCSLQGGISQGPGTSCATVFCPQPTEACCYMDGTCSDLYSFDCFSTGGMPQGPGTTCGTVFCPQPLEACCYPDGTCVDTYSSDCFSTGGTPQGPGTTCATTFCPQPVEACCYPDGTCTDAYPSDCLSAGGTPQGPGTTCGTITCPAPLEACCLPDGSCTQAYSMDCQSMGGTPLGAASQCLGDSNGNGQDDACEPTGPCGACGPGPHWIDNPECPAGMDIIATAGLFGIDTNLDCVGDSNVIMSGPVRISRSAPRDDSLQFPGLRPVDGHLDVIDTQIVQMNLSGGGVTLIAGAGMGAMPLAPSLGAIAEQPTDPSLADSFFDVFFEVDLGGGMYAYNQTPLRVEAIITCVPPIAIYVHPTQCVPLYTSPIPGTGALIGNLVSASHDTYPQCGSPATGDCFTPHDTPFCNDGVCCHNVCDVDSFCCEGSWDDTCVGHALELCQPQACCLPDATCIDAYAPDCYALGGIPQGVGTDCSTTVCTVPVEACCYDDGSCDDAPVDQCAALGGTPQGAGSSCATVYCPVPLTACCFSDGSCTETYETDCVSLGGTPLGPGSACLGDNDGDGVDDACQPTGPCGACGPGPHWIDNPACPPGMDNITTAGLFGLDINLDCDADSNVVMGGPVKISRSGAMDDSTNFPGLRPVDGHLDVIDTEMIEMTMSGGGVTLIAGAGLGNIPLAPSLGAIAEQPGDPSLADSFFDVFFEVDLGGGMYAYNQTALRVEAVITCVPPIAIYVHPTQCVPLYTSPIPGTGVLIGNLVSASHDTYPQCGSPAAGSCFEPHDTPFCDDAECCYDVCEVDPYCCEVEWDETCVDEAIELCTFFPPFPDYWNTWIDGTPDRTYQDVTIPAGFFGATCEAYTGRIEFIGEPLDEATLGNADTCVQRGSDPVVATDPVGAMGTTSLEINALSLVSADPITVICGGMPTQWDVRAGLSPTTPAPKGSLVATKTHANGGTFDSTLYVQPLLTFTEKSGGPVAGCGTGDNDGDGDSDMFDFAEVFRCMTGPGVPVTPDCLCVDTDGDGDADLADVGDFQNYFGVSGNVVVLDTGLEGMPPVQFTAAAAPFVHTVDPGLGVVYNPEAKFVPGIVETVPGDTTSQTPQVVTEEAKLARHTVCIPVPKCEVDLNIKCSVDAVENAAGAFVQKNIAAVTTGVGGNFPQLKFNMRPFTITAAPANGTLVLAAGTAGVIEIFKDDGTAVPLPATINNFAGPVTWLINGLDIGTTTLTATYTPPGGMPCMDTVRVRVNCFPGLVSENLTAFPNAEYVRAINRSGILTTSLDPVRHAERVGMRYAIYVVPHKSAGQYAMNAALADATGTIEEFNVADRTIAANEHIAWNPANPADATRAFDVIYDFGNCPDDPANFMTDARLDPGDIIGLLTLNTTDAELNVLDDPGVAGTTAFMSSIYDIGTFDIPARFDDVPNAFNGIRRTGRFVRPNPLPAGTPLVAIAHGNHNPFMVPTAMAPVIPGGRDGTASAVTVSQDAVNETWTLTLQGGGTWSIVGSVSMAQGNSSALGGGLWTVASTNGFIRLTITQGATMPFVAGDVITFMVNRTGPTATAPMIPGGRDGTAGAVTVSPTALAESWTLTLQASGRWRITGSRSGAQGETGVIGGGMWMVASTNGFIRLTITQGATMPFVAGDMITFMVNVTVDPLAPNFDGYLYLQEHLASHGIASISVDLDRFSSLFPGIRHRGWTLIQDIDAVLGANANLSRTNITLVGHSRGGEAVLQAFRMLSNAGERPAGGAIANFNAAAIQGIASISPTVFHDANPRATLPVIPGGRDGSASEVGVSLDARNENWTLTLGGGGTWAIAGTVSGAQGASSALGGGMWTVRSTNGHIQLTITQGAAMPFVAGDVITFSTRAGYGNTLKSAGGLTPPFLLIYGGADGDVNGISRGVRPFETYDRAVGVKQVVFVEGANHNFFNTSWVCDDGRQQLFAPTIAPAGIICKEAVPAGMGDNLVSAPDARQLCKAYVTAFVFKHARNRPGYDDYFKRFHNRFRPPSVPASLQLLGQYKDTTMGAPRNFVVDDYEAQPATTTSSSGNPVALTVTVNPFMGVNEPLLRDPDEFWDYAGPVSVTGIGAVGTGGVRPGTLELFFSSNPAGMVPAGRTGSAIFAVRQNPMGMRSVAETWTLTYNLAMDMWAGVGSVSGAQGMSGTKMGGQWRFVATNGRLVSVITDGAGGGAFANGDTITYTFRGINLDETQSVNRFMQETMGVIVSWPAAVRNYQYELPAAERNLTDNRYISVRVAKTVPDPAMRGMPIEFTVVLEDTTGRTSSVRTNTFSTIPGGYVSRFRHDYRNMLHMGNVVSFEFDRFTTTPVFRTFRFEICSFTNLGNAIDLRNVRFIRLEFGGASGTNNGMMAIDDAEVTIR